MMNCNTKLTFVINTQLIVLADTAAGRNQALHAQIIHSRYVSMT